MVGETSQQSTNEEPWAAADRAYFTAHPGHVVYVRDIMKGEVPSLKTSKLMIKLEGSGLYDSLRRHLRAFPPGGASIRVAVLKIGRWTYLRVPVLDWKGRDQSLVWREEADDNIRQIPAESVVARCKELIKQDRWDARSE